MLLPNFFSLAVFFAMSNVAVSCTTGTSLCSSRY